MFDFFAGGSIFFCLSVLPLLPASAAAYGQLTYEIVDGEAVITDCNQQKNIYFQGDAPVFTMYYDKCYSHEENPWDDLDFDFSAEHEFVPFEYVNATVYYPCGASGWESVTSQSMTGRGCGMNAPRGQLTLEAQEQQGTATISGCVTAFGEGAVMLELVSEDGNVTSCSVTDGVWKLADITPGSYWLTVSQTGSVSRSYSLTLDEGEHTLDLKLHCPGDINGNGVLRMCDVSRIYAHIRSTELLADYQLACADTNGDGKVNMGDVSKLYAIIRAGQT